MLGDLEKKAMDAVDVANMMASVDEIAKYVRLSGSEEELEAMRLVERKMSGYGYRTSLMKHDAYISLPISARLRIVEPEALDMNCITHSASVSTPSGGVDAEVVWAGDPRNIDKINVRGKFVVVDGNASPGATVLAAKGGALGQIHVSLGEHIHEMTVQNVWGNPDDENVATLPRTHVVSIARADGERIREMLGKGPVTVHVETKVETRWTKIPLLQCDIDGNGGTGDFLLLSGHLDSWYYGAMDNGSANATMMEVARVLASMKPDLRRGVRVCFWSGHSHGRYAGSAWYCDNHWEELNKHCVMHLNTDSTGAINATELRYASIMPETRAIAAWAINEVMGIPFEGTRIGRNGDQSFWGIGIPSMFVSLSTQPKGEPGSEDFGLGWWWHNPADLPDKIDPANLLRDTRIYALVAARLTTSPVLPFDYAATMDEWMGVVGTIQGMAGDKFDLVPVMERCKQLKALLGRLNAVGTRCDESDQAINECLMKVGRALVPVSFTGAGRFGQDPALDGPPLRDIAGATRLQRMAADSDPAKFLKVRLARGRNRVMAALDEARGAVSEALEMLR